MIAVFQAVVLFLSPAGLAAEEALNAPRNGAGASKRAYLHELLADALEAARTGDLKTLGEREKSLSSLNEVIFRAYNGLDMQGTIRKAAALKQPDVLVRTVAWQILLSISLLLKESLALSDPGDIKPRLQQAVLNYQVIAKCPAEISFHKKKEIGEAFRALEKSLSGEVKGSLPIVRTLDSLMGNPFGPSKSGKPKDS